MSKRYRTIVLATSPLVVLLALALVAALQVERVTDDAARLASSGQAAIHLLNEIAGAVRTGDVERLADAYHAGYDQPAAAEWARRRVSKVDGVEIDQHERGAARSPGHAAAIEQLLALRDDVAELTKVRFKLARVEQIVSPTAMVVRGVLWLRGTDLDGQGFETFLRLRLVLDDVGGGFKVRRHELVSGETVRGPRRGFGDVAAAVGLDFVSSKNPAFTTEEWFPERFEIIQYGTAGTSAVDYDGDGWYDLFFGDGAGYRLYRNQGDGHFADVTRQAGLPDDHHANVGLFADFDGDGVLDLVTAGYTVPVHLYAGDGDGGFTDVTASAGLGGFFVVVASAVDYDLDGDLDLYLGRYLDARVDLPTTLFYTRNGQGNSLLRNDGGLRFTDVTEEAGVAEGGLTLGTVWGDWDRDGDPDLYVANDFGRNAMLRNDGDGSFTDVTAETGSLDFGFGMSADAADADGDGDLDLYVSNVHSGQRWYGQSATLYQYLINSLRQGTIGEDLPLYKEIYHYAGPDWSDYGDGMVKGNSLLLNDGTGVFTEVAERVGANPFGWYWGSLFFDYDNDGWQDIYAANGWISGELPDDL